MLLAPCSALAQMTANSKPSVPPWKIASNQASTSTSVLGPTAALATAKKNRGPAVISDSLWGNLMLEIAFNRDPVLEKYGVMVKLMNFAVMSAVYGVSGGTLLQTCYAVPAINQPAPHQDSSVPGIVGIVNSSVAVVSGASRLVIGYELSSHIRKRQMQIRDQLEAILAKLEDSHCEDATSLAQLKDLIGERASGEWVQIWRNVHLSTEAHRIGMAKPAQPDLVADAKTPEESK
jgi:hypothetical protein